MRTSPGQRHSRRTHFSSRNERAGVGLVRPSAIVISLIVILASLAPFISASQVTQGYRYGYSANVLALDASGIQMTARFADANGVLSVVDEPRCNTFDTGVFSIAVIEDLECYSLSRNSDRYVDLRISWKERVNIFAPIDWIAARVNASRNGVVTLRVELNATLGMLSTSVVSKPSWLADWRIGQNYSNEGWVPGSQPTQDPDEEFPAELPPSGVQPTIQPIEPVEQPDTPPGSGCNDAGVPQAISPLTVTPSNPDTSTTVTFSVTIHNAGCGVFAPTVLAIGGRNPNPPPDNISDPLQDREFRLGPGESRVITHTAVLTIPGRHEFFMAYLRVNGGWNEIPDSSGTLPQHIFVDVVEGTGVQEPPATEPPIEQEPSSTEPPTSVEPTTVVDQGPAQNVQVYSEVFDGSCVTGVSPYIQGLQVGEDTADPTGPKTIQFAIVNGGCEPYVPRTLRVVDLAPGDVMETLYGTSSLQIDPMSSMTVSFDISISQPGEHSIWVEAETAGADSAVEVLLDDQGDSGVLVFGIRHDGLVGFDDEPEETDDPIVSDGDGGSEFTAGCHYSWSWDPEFWVQSCGGTSGNLGSALSEPVEDGCTYYFDGSQFYQDFDYECWTANEPPSDGSTDIYSSERGEFVSGMSAGCTYNWSDWEGIWYESCSVGEYVLSNLVDPPLSEPVKDGCDYYFDGSQFYALSWC